MAALAGVLSVMTFTAVPASAGASAPGTFTETDQTQGVAELLGSTCPFGDWAPIVDTVCEDWQVLLYRESVPADRRTTAWRVGLVRDQVLVHPDGSYDVLMLASGDVPATDSAFDEIHLKFARVNAAIAMSDGTTRIVDLDWDGTASPLQTAGNDGPANLASGTPPHVSDRCFTLNLHAHQTYRSNVALAGVVDGTDVRDLPYVAPYDPFLGRGLFTITYAGHGGCR
jgi:hypothetical protein